MDALGSQYTRPPALSPPGNVEAEEGLLFVFETGWREFFVGEEATQLLQGRLADYDLIGFSDATKSCACVRGISDHRVAERFG